MRLPGLVLATSVLAVSLLGCASLRQSMRGQELSYRGAWYCASGACKASEMTKSTSGSRDGTININTVKFDPKSGMAFTAAAPFEQLTATVTDCKGKQASVPASDIVRPGKHGVTDQDARESWIVWVDPAALGKLAPSSSSCVWKVEATATWEDGVTFSLTAGLNAKGG
ncbi:hypothetical protein DB30_00862 [Enhygromyxa salina]|uniref:Lipoprotein n=1 Tax=Enhygromyxa salina TaxID=215803 RepID=A0A0C2CNU5_9BACT|nr:hypothetical protein [Enhygromyxa salina]KIG12906.1 hypothetical protein DB30_00862 [Enhygromyxa salina]